MSVETIFDIPNQAVTVNTDIESGDLLVPPIALGPGEWNVTWNLPGGYNFVSLELSGDGWPPLLRVGPSAKNPANDQQWTATLDNLCEGANAASYTISVQPPDGGPVITKDPTIVVTKDPIDTVRS